MNQLNNQRKEFIEVINRIKREKITGSDINLSDIVILYFLDAMLEKIDTIILLCKNNRSISAEGMCRAFVEMFFYLSYILKEDTEKRCKAFYIKSVFYDENELITDIRKYVSPSEVLQNSLLQKIHTDQEKEKNEADKVYRELFNYKKTNGKEQQPWYNFDKNTRSIWDLCKYIGEREKYDLMYKYFSKSVHGTNRLKNFVIDVEKGDIKYGSPDNKAVTAALKTIIPEILEKIKEYYTID